MKKLILSAFTALLLAACCNQDEMVVKVSNNSDLDRENETVEINWKDIKNIPPDSVIVFMGDEQIPSQVVYEGKEEPQKLIFQVTLKAGQTQAFKVDKGSREEYESKTFGRLVPERFDDFAWENDKIAYRTYGPALEAKGEASNGLDVWVKSTDKLIINKWYKDDLAGIASYHEDHGEGLDYYSVGRTLGAGSMSPYVNDSIWLANSFKDYKVLDNGPIRTSFQLDYAPFNVNGKMMTESKVFSIDAGTHFNKITQTFSESVTAAAGIVKREKDDEYSYDENKTFIAYTEPDSDNGFTSLALVFPTPCEDIKIANGHLLGLVNANPSATYYAGAGWSKAGFDSHEKWVEYVKTFSNSIQNPLKVEIQ